MRRPVLALFLASAVSAKSIEHVFVLMLENRAFDHMLGFLKQQNSAIDGCLPGQEQCSNPIDPSNPVQWVSVSNDAVYVQASPSHSISGTTQQIYPLGEYNTSNIMGGFIKSYSKLDQSQGATVMQCFAPEHVPIISTLATEFMTIDGWFASVPGPTEVNRAYASSATSHGMGTNDDVTLAKGLPQKTMFRQLREMGLDYRVYFQLVPSVLIFKEMRRKDARQRYHILPQLFEDLKSGNAANFTWIEPAYYDTPGHPATDQHPDHDVSAGEQLIKDVYEAIRASPLWEKSALLITYDEHGGFFDHVPPPINVPSPDNISSTDDPFDFTRLGVRVPTVLVSPYVPRGSVLHAQDYGMPQFEHSSIVSTVVHKLFRSHNPLYQPEFLTARDAWARTFESAFSLAVPRKDCIESLPEVPNHRLLFPNSLPPLDGKLPLTELQIELVLMVAGIDGDELSQSLTADVVSNWTEMQGADYLEPRVSKFLASMADDE